MIIESIRRHLSKEVYKNEKDVFRSKYLGIASITKMSSHRGVNFFDIHSHSGHSLGTNKEMCLYQNILALTTPREYALNGWVDATTKKSYPSFHYLSPNMTKQAHFMIKELYIVSVPQLKQYESIYPVLLASTSSLFMHQISVGTHVGHEKYVYTKLCKSAEKSKIKDFNRPRNEPLIILDYCSKNIEEDFHLHSSENIYLSEKYAAKDLKNLMNTTVKHVNSMEQGMVGIQEKLIESDNERVKQSISIDKLIWENISTKQNLRQLLYLINDVHTKVKKYQKLLQGVQVY